jgi:hypothetical protein
MRKKSLRSWILCLLLLATVCVTYASTTILIGSLTTVNNTTANSSSVLATTFLPNPGSFLISDGGLTATTAMAVVVSFSLDNVNFTNVATNFPTTTAATTYTWNPSFSALPIWERVSVVTTNSVSAGVIIMQ